MMNLKCCICDKKFNGYGNNPSPIKHKGLCCNDCNYQVITERLKLVGITKEYVQDVLMEKYKKE